MLKLKPALKDYLWGGTKLRTDFGFQSDKDIIAEGWMLSCHKDGESIVENGEYKGKTLSEVIELCGKDVLGKDCEKFDFFPILIKLIDAKKDLSVQVHPDNEYAMRVEGEYGKTECWYILDCDDGAELIYGFNREISSEEFKKRIENNTFLEVVNKVKVHKGDMFFIEAGTLHAIGSGILLAEIQQNSNTTYRVYDYQRKDKDGNLRPLHIDKAVDVTKCDLFTVEEYIIDGTQRLFTSDKSFVSLLVTDGCGTIESSGEKLEAHKGDSFFVFAGSGDIEINGKLNIISTEV